MPYHMLWCLVLQLPMHWVHLMRWVRFFSGILAALSILWIKSVTKLREDAVIGFIFTTFFLP